MNLIDEMAVEAISDKYFLDLLSKTERLYWSSIFPTDTLSRTLLTSSELHDILRFSDILSLSSTASHRNIALKIISCLHVFYSNNPKYQYFAQGIMLRLGNFPAFSLLKKDQYSFVSSLDLQIEEDFKREINKDKNSGRIFTDSQFNVFQGLLNRNHFSFSGPTSFGKSFIITSFIKSILLNNKSGTNIVMLLPTRALVSQTLNKFREIMLDVQGYSITASPEIPALLRRSCKHYIFIFTPERLLHYFSNPSNPSIEYVFIDEAQKLVSEDTRSVIYYHAISIAERNSCKLFFASPNIKNSDIFLRLFNKSTNESLVITESPVCQMRVFVDLLNGSATFFSDLVNPYSIELPHGITLYKLIDQFSKHVDPSGYKTLIYCNTIEDTINCAKQMADQLDDKDSPELNKAADEIAKFIHKQYYLVRLIRKGIAFHFGKLPQKVREIVEELYEHGSLHYLFCTSTLLEGVNLPAQNIFILNNQIGNHNLSSVDFWNLAGRAGRLAHELCGNVICVRWSAKEGRWTTDASLSVIKAKDIEAINSDIISGKSNFYRNIYNATVGKPFTRKNVSNEQKKVYQSYSNVLLSHFTDCQASLLRNKFQEKELELVPEILRMRNSLSVPSDIVSRFPNIRAQYQNDIWNELPIAIIPLAEPTYDNCLRMLNYLSSKYNWVEEESSGTHPMIPKGNLNILKYYAALMCQWMNSTPISQIISSNLKSHIGKSVSTGYSSSSGLSLVPFDQFNSQHINTIINDTIADIDSFIRFTLKNYFENYYCIIERKYGTSRAGNDWATFMEHGTSNRSLIEIQKLGISRHLSSLFLSDFSDCLQFRDGELINLNRSGLMKKICQDKSEKYTELKSDLINNYIIPDF